MTARLLPSPNALNLARQPSELELAAYPVIDDLFRTVDRLTQQADTVTVEDVDATLARLGGHLIAFLALAAQARQAKADQEQAADWLAALAWAGA